MKKLLMVFALVCASVGFGETSNVYTNVYDFKASIKVPYLNDGVRNYKTQGFVGDMYLVYDGENLVDASIIARNKKTKVDHVIRIHGGFYNLMGKTTRKEYRSVPTVFFEGNDINDAVGHERITFASLSGTGKISSIETTTVTCESCSGTTRSTESCSNLKSMTGNIVGIMDCQCPEGETWDHTLKAGICGVLSGDLMKVRSHEASFRGTWTAKFNKKVTASVND